MELIIDILYFETNTVIDTDFDTNKAYNHIVEAHEIGLYELLGKELYDRVQTALANPGTDLPAEDLADRCKQFVLKASEVSLIPFLNNPVTAKGTQDRNGNFTTSTNDTNAGIILHSIREKKEVYAQRVRDFLDDNKTVYTEWDKCKGDQNFYTTIHGV